MNNIIRMNHSIKMQELETERASDAGATIRDFIARFGRDVFIKLNNAIEDSNELITAMKNRLSDPRTPDQIAADADWDDERATRESVRP